MFALWFTITTFFALSFENSYILWDRNIKTVILFFVVCALANTPGRIHTIVWTIVICLLYFSLKGGIFTLLGGEGRVLGPPRTAIADNNHLALAICVVIPLMNYLRLSSANWLTRLALLGAMFASVLSVLGTYSRGGLIGLCILLGAMWLRSKQKIVTALAAVLVVYVSAQVLPSRWTDRMSTISSAAEGEGDRSFLGRLDAWEFAFNAARSRLSGVGFSGTEIPAIFQQYGSGALGGTEARAAHSIYFQVLGDHGFPGLVIFLALIAAALITTRRIIREARPQPELKWAADLGQMIQLSFIAWAAAGAALSMAYYDVMYILMGIIVSLHVLVTRARQPVPGALAAVAPFRAAAGSGRIRSFQPQRNS
jgi:putative inorganic carbon (hco3(-)) transporter